MHKLLAAAVALVAFFVIVVPGVIALLMGQSEKGGVKNEVKDAAIHVYLHELDKIESMSLEAYVKGVLAAEMPAEFEPEALKAQAIAARTFAIKHMRSFGGKGVKGKDADISDDSAKDQAYLGEQALKARWGAKYDAYRLKITNAVESTAGQIIVYDGQPISAVFHSTSGGKTAAAKEVWGNDLPYLQSVTCDWDQASPRYKDTKEISVSELERALGEDAGIVAAAQSGGGGLAQVLSLTDSGRVKEVRIGDKTFSGREVRTALGLRSENFTAETRGDRLIFRTIGYGHGVGMCQYGANGMAKAGKNCEEILTHYYKGVHLKHFRQT